MKRTAPAPASTRKFQNFNDRPAASAPDDPLGGPEARVRSAPPPEDALERPTTFQLAQLAAILATRPESLRIPPAEVVLEAMQVWEAAAKVNLAERQEREIWDAIFTDRKEQWEHRLGAYVGDEVRLHELLSEP